MTADKQATLAALVKDLADRRVGHTGTIYASQLSSPEPLLDGGKPLVLGEVIGRGGMGVVQAATQTSLERPVAVKRSLSEANATELVAEARLTGSLQHPGVVPVHLLQEIDSTPCMVMKRVEGRPWSDVLADDELGHSFAGERELLTFHAEIMLSVARTIDYAHSRGLVHRDIKPENVMVGEFGEVYLMDWGIAARIEDLDRDVEEVSGTPGYMSPEQALGSVRDQGTATDVYLLGATLFHVLARKPPHEGSNLMEVLLATVEGTRATLPAGVPAQLADLVRVSMVEKPEDRPTAAAFIQALQRWLDRRAAMPLLEIGNASLDRLEELVGHGDVGSGADEAYLAALSAFRQALRIDPELPEARRALGYVQQAGIEMALVRRDLPRAKALLGEAGPIGDELERRVQELEKVLEAEAAEIGALRAQRKELLTGFATLGTARAGVAGVLLFSTPYMVLQILGVELTWKLDLLLVYLPWTVFCAVLIFGWKWIVPVRNQVAERTRYVFAIHWLLGTPLIITYFVQGYSAVEMLMVVHLVLGGVTAGYGLALGRYVVAAGSLWVAGGLFGLLVPSLALGGISVFFALSIVMLSIGARRGMSDAVTFES